MNRFAWHIPLGILTSLLVHFCVLALLLGGLSALWPSPSEPLESDRAQPAAPVSLPKNPEPKIINEGTTIQFR